MSEGNTGKENSGDLNSGNRNSGDWNSGHRNSGNRNSGDWNSGNRNSGYLNSGNRNSGHRNSGDWNSGNRNSGYWNSGDWNSGHRNSGDRNSGDLNSGDWNSGYLNSDTPKARMFNKDTNLTHEEAFALIPELFHNLVITEWVTFASMTDEEKKAWPEAYVCDGYLKTHDYKAAWATLWKRATKEDVEKTKALPNFDAAIFEEITGIKIDGDDKKRELLDKADELIRQAKELKEKAEAM